MQGHVYHWKHGWIPLDHIAARIKAKGSESGMHRYVAQYHIPDRRAGGERRTAEREAGKATPTTRGGFEYRRGTPTSRYPQRPEGAAPSGGPTSAAEAFGMKRAELEPHAKAGNPHAQAELDRRAAKHAGGKAPTAPKAPRATPKAPAPFTPRQDPNPDAHLPGAEKRDAETAAALRGKTDAELADLATKLRPGSGAHTAVLAEQARRHALPKVPTPGAKPVPYTGTSSERAANAATMFGHNSPQHQAAVAAEDREIEAALGAGHKLKGHPSASGRGVFTTHHVEGNYRGIGSSSSRMGGGFQATHHTYTPKGYQRDTPLGTFDTRLAAHKAIADAQAAHEAQTAAANARKAARAAKTGASNDDAATRIAKAARGVNGQAWQPVNLDDGTYTGRVAASRARYAFASGNKRVVVEAAMTEDEATGLLNDTADVLGRAGRNAEHIPVTVRVPKGDHTFSWKSEGGNTGGYVMSGTTVIHVNPVVARGEARAASFGHQHGGTHFMPVNGTTHARAYVLTHELGHVVDGQNKHTRDGWSFGTEAAALHSQQRQGMGLYGRKNPAEGYAEAWSQHQLGGVGSHPVSDAYAARYGWHAPATKYADPTKASSFPDRLGQQLKAGEIDQATHDRLLAGYKRLTDARSTGATLRDATTRRG